MGYTDAGAIAAYFSGRTFNANETAQATVCADAASGFVDRYTGRTWAGTTITNELHTLFGRSLQLNRYPVVSISSVTVRSSSIGATPRTLAAGVDYELIDPSHGVLLVRAFWTMQPDRVTSGPLASVSYTVGATVPPEITLAATIIAATMLQPTLDPNSPGIDQYQIGRELMVKYTSIDKMPADAKRLLDGWKRPAVFA